MLFIMVNMVKMISRLKLKSDEHLLTELYTGKRENCQKVKLSPVSTEK